MTSILPLTQQICIVSSDIELAKDCQQKISPVSGLNITATSVDDALEITTDPVGIFYVCENSSKAYMHILEALKARFVRSCFFVGALSLSIPLLHHCLRLGVDDAFLLPMSKLDIDRLLCNLMGNDCESFEQNNIFLSKGHCPEGYCQTLKQSSPFEMLLMVIEKDFKKAPSLEDLGKRVHLSASRLSHLFREMCGLTYRNYLLCRRLEEGERLLREQNNSVTDIAYELGFSSPSHFCRSFKVHFNVTPHSYATGEQNITVSDLYQSYQRLRNQPIEKLNESSLTI
ncbi:helix-turn-helix transcriptional regulator [Thalassotalea aquiviva]|uniref:helix-turn-helix transcriptional regulator n=1 Tax=Thalassotalea aquiviva TaxID=3242415 RepID=UPI003529DA3E